MSEANISLFSSLLIEFERLPLRSDRFLLSSKYIYKESCDVIAPVLKDAVARLALQL
jgi:hypothetical protein